MCSFITKSQFLGIPYAMKKPIPASTEICGKTNLKINRNRTTLIFTAALHVLPTWRITFQRTNLIAISVL